MKLCLTGFLVFLTIHEWVAFARANQRGRVSVRSNPSPNAFLEYRRVLDKYNIDSIYPDPLHNDAIRAPRRRQIGGDVASITSDKGGYGSVVTVGEGEDAKSFNIQFDTGSGDFWLYSTLFLESEQFEGNVSHSIYDPLNSSTAKPSNQIFQLVYGSGNVSGVVFHDTVTFAGFELKNQPVDAAMFTDTGNLDPQDFELDGLFGLFALGKTNVFPGPKEMILKNLFFDGDNSPEDKVFTALLTRPGEPDGFYTFGFIDEDVIGNATINFSPLYPTSNPNLTIFWLVPTTFADVNGERLGNDHGMAIVDTGTTLILLPEDITEAVYKPLGGSFDNNTGLWLFPSNFTEDQLPSVNLPIGDFNLTLPPKDIIFNDTIIPGFVIGSIQSIPGLNFSIYGDIWLRNVYAIFDMGSGNRSDFRFGFVPRAPGVLNSNGTIQ